MRAAGEPVRCIGTAGTIKAVQRVLAAAPRALDDQVCAPGTPADASSSGLLLPCAPRAYAICISARSVSATFSAAIND